MTLSMMDPQVLNLQQESPLPDSITCGQCSLKFYHVSLFLKHKSTCAGDSDNKKDAASDTDSMKKEEPEPGGTFLCLACPASVYPSRDLLRLHLLDAHGVYLPAGVDLSSMLQETKAYQVHPETAKKIAAIRSKKYEEGSNEGSDSSVHSLSSNDGKEEDSGNDSERKQELSAQDLSVSPGGSAGGVSAGSSGQEVDSGNGEMRSPIATSVDHSKMTTQIPGLPGLPSNMARSILENMVASRLRANLEQSKAAANNNDKPQMQPTGLSPYAGLGQLGPLMPFGPGFPGLANNMSQVNSLVTAQQNAVAAAAAAQARNNDTTTLYQPAVKRRRRGYGSEVGTENLRIERDGEGYCCPLCNYKSRVRSNLTIHLRTHTGYKPYKCPYCPYSSSQSGPLKIHIRGHTGEKPYRCEYCSYASTCRGNLKVHQERHHKEEIIKHGLNAGIRGPNDFDENSDKLSENEIERSDDELIMQEEPMKSEPESLGSKLNLPLGSPQSTGTPIMPRIPPFTLPGFPPTSLPGFHNFGLPQPHFTGGFNPQQLAALFKPKMDHLRPHFPLNITPPTAHHMPSGHPLHHNSEPDTATITEVDDHRVSETAETVEMQS